MADILISLNTLALNDTAVIAAINLVTMYQTKHEKIVLYPSIDDQIECGRTIDDDTMAWWSKQDNALVNSVFTEDRQSFVDTMQKLHNIIWTAKGKIWCNRLLFEIPMLTTAFKMTKKPVAWQFYNLRDTSTLFDYCNVKPTNDISENAKLIQACFKNR